MIRLAIALSLIAFGTVGARAQVVEQSALQFAIAQQPAIHSARVKRHHSRYGRRWAKRHHHARRYYASYRVGSPLDIRTPTQLIAVAKRYLGSRNFTRLRGPWCAAALRAWLARSGHSTRGTDNRAISFARYGRPAGGPRIGSIAVMRHHVGIVIGHSRRGPVLLSGNHGHRVGVGVYSRYRILAYREPV